MNVRSWNPRVWLRDWLNKPTASELAAAAVSLAAIEGFRAERDRRFAEWTASGREFAALCAATIGHLQKEGGRDATAAAPAAVSPSAPEACEPRQ